MNIKRIGLSSVIFIVLWLATGLYDNNKSKTRRLNMYKSKTLLGILLCGMIASFVLGCAEAPPGSKLGSQRVAEEFVKIEGTFRFDGIPETLKLTGTVSIAGGWKFIFDFDSRYGGYGNRTGQVLAHVITHHEVEVEVKAGRVVSAM